MRQVLIFLVNITVQYLTFFLTCVSS